jgi:6-phosphogluconolactonase (cycloisomerase 2 family)
MVRNFVKVLMCALFCSLPAGVAWADGAVYAKTNALGNNQVLVFHRGADGNLTSTPVQTISTGGGGGGLQLSNVDSLGSAGSMQLDQGHHFLFVVNPESAKENTGAGAYNTDCQQGTITSFRVADDGTLTFADRVSSGGLFPNSLTVRKLNSDDDNQSLLYVLNAGGPQVPICHLTPNSANTPNVTGFLVDGLGRMKPVESTQPIDPGPASAASGVSCTADVASRFSGLFGSPAADFQCGLNPPSFPRSPAQVRFTPDGGQLLVTVKGTNTIYVFSVNKNGTLGAHPKINQAPGPALPSFFGFEFSRNGDLVTTELFGSAAIIPAGGTGALSSFSITGGGDLQPISSHVNDGGTAACWIALEPITGRFAFVSNNLSASISSYSVGDDGTVTLLNATANGSTTTAGPNDLVVVTENGASFLFVTDSTTGTIGAFQINLANGSLSALNGGSGLPVGSSAEGIAAF